MTAHVHKDLIIAWANGAKIQRWCTDVSVWVDELTPGWECCLCYRIKPEILKYKRYVTKDCAGNGPAVFCLQYDKRNSYFPDKDKKFVKWIDTKWQEIDL